MNNSNIPNIETAEEELRQSNASLTVINMISNALYHSLDYETVLQKTAKAMDDFFQAPSVSIFLLNEKDNRLDQVFASDPDIEPARLIRTLPLKKGSLTALTVDRGEIIICEDVAKDEIMRPDVRAAIIKWGRKTILSLPLLFHDQILGAMNLFFAEKRTFTEREKETFLSVGKTIGLALTNARHVSQLQAEITERKKVESALRESENKYRSIFNNTTEGIFQATPEGKIITSNPALAKILGYASPEDINNAIKNLQTDLFVQQERGEEFLHLMERDGLVRNFEYLAYRKNRSFIAAAMNVDAVCDENRNVLYYEGTLRDISDLKKYQERMEELVRKRTNELISANKKMQEEIAEHRQTESQREAALEALRLSEEKFFKIFHKAPLLMSINDIANGAYLDVNEKWIEISGFSREEALSKTVWDLGFISREDAIHLTEKIKHHLRIKNIELYFQTKNKKKVCCIYASEIITIGGKQVLLSISQDITEMKKMEDDKAALEERLQRSEKMEALGMLAGGVAHDLNNILGVLVGYSDLLLMEVTPEHDLYRYVNNILKSGDRAATIIQDLLTLARRGIPVAEIVNLNKIISDHLATPQMEALRSLHPLVTVISNLEKDLLNIKGSPVHLGQTFMNLMSNAAEAITDQGEITIKTENIYLDKPINEYEDINKGEYVILKISDTGRGIPQKDIGRIFEPFYTKKIMGRSGTGLGLAVVWGTIKDHHGFINVQSEEGKGSVFNLYFPAVRDEVRNDQQAISLESYKGNGETILVIDDVLEQRELAAQMLQKLGYQVSAVSSGEEAVSYIKKNKVALLILDMIMEPGIDGLETYRRILHINPVQKAIIVSGFSETERVKKAQLLGAGSYVRKPYVIENIGVAVRKELTRK